uniref:Uncharacterized protein n=1 Tax=Panagrolaimus sp. ES5 TaxID=591445 RepID=A0AC34FFR6_9BILA
MFVHLTAKNNGKSYENIKIKAKLSSFDLKDCSWSEEYMFGLLDNINGCKIIKECPIESGNFERKIPMDLSRFGDVAGFLLGNEVTILVIFVKY